MAVPEENVHALTLEWWQSLPWAYRDADSRQGYDIGPPWHGLNRDPRFVTGFDSWARTNTSTKPWEASIALTRRFPVEPGAPVLLRSWHTPAKLADLTDTTSELGAAALGLMRLGETTTTVRVRHTMRNHTGEIQSEQTVDLTGDPEQTVDTWWTPDRFGVLHATVEVTVNVPGMMDALRAIHVGNEPAEFSELPDATDFKIARPYPLLRFMDGVGFQAGIVSDTVEQMHNGGWTDPATAPDIALPYLAAILGLPTDYTDQLTTPRLREHLVGLVDGGTPSAGTVAAITTVARQWLTGDKQVAVIPAHTLEPRDPEGARTALINALAYNDGNPTTIQVQDTAPMDGYETVGWTGELNASTSTWTLNGALRYENLFRNPSFAFNVDHWATEATGTLTHDTTRTRDNLGSARITMTGDTLLKLPTGERIPSAGGDHTLRFWVYTTATNAQCTAIVRGHSTDGTLVSTQTGTSTLVTPNTWQKVEVTGPVGNAATLDPGLLIKAPSGTVVHVDHAQFSRTTHTAPGYFDGNTTAPTPPFWHDIWVTPRGTAHTWEGSEWAHEPAVSAQAEKVALGGVTRRDLHTLILLCKADEVPNNDIAAFQQFLNTSGIVPAGHALTAKEASPTWEQWQTYVGDTWATMHTRAPRWVDHHSAGIDLGDTP